MGSFSQNKLVFFQVEISSVTPTFLLNIYLYTQITNYITDSSLSHHSKSLIIHILLRKSDPLGMYTWDIHTCSYVTTRKSKMWKGYVGGWEHTQSGLTGWVQSTISREVRNPAYRPALPSLLLGFICNISKWK